MDAYPLSYPPDSPLAISYRNHQKSLAYFSHLATNFVLFTKRQRQKGGGGMAQCSPLNTLLPRSLRLGACEWIIPKHIYKKRTTMRYFDLMGLIRCVDIMQPRHRDPHSVISMSNSILGTTALVSVPSSSTPTNQV